MRTPYLVVKKEVDGRFIVSHNWNGELAFSTEQEVSEEVFNLICLAIGEGKRRRSQELMELLKG